MPRLDVTTAAEAAHHFGCTRQLIYQALDDGRLTDRRIGRTRLVVMDKKYREFRVRELGGRTHRRRNK